MSSNEQIRSSEKIGLKLTKAERELLLTGMLYMPEHVEQAIRETAASQRVMISLADLESLVGHVAGEANHTKDKRIEDVLDGIFIKIEALLAKNQYRPQA